MPTRGAVAGMTLTWALLGTNAVAARVSAPMSGSTPTVTAAGGTITTRGAVASTIPLAVLPGMNVKLAGTLTSALRSLLMTAVVMSGSTPTATAATGTIGTLGNVAWPIPSAVLPGMNAKLARTETNDG